MHDLSTLTGEIVVSTPAEVIAEALTVHQRESDGCYGGCCATAVMVALYREGYRVIAEEPTP